MIEKYKTFIEHLEAMLFQAENEEIQLSLQASIDHLQDAVFEAKRLIPTIEDLNLMALEAKRDEMGGR